MSKNGLNKKKAGIFGFFIIAIFVLLMALILFSGPGSSTTYTLPSEVGNDIKKVCNGLGVSEAEMYDENVSKIHPVAIINLGIWDNVIYSSKTDISQFTSGQRDFNNFAILDTPKTWQPNTTNQVELVACLEFNKVLIEECQYKNSITGGTEIVLRSMYEGNMELRNAKTGSIIDSKDIEGSTPQRCPSSTTRSFFTGDFPTSNQFYSWITRFVKT